MHRVDQDDALLHAALGDQSHYFFVQRDDGPPLGDFQPEFFGERFHDSGCRGEGPEERNHEWMGIYTNDAPPPSLGFAQILVRAFFLPLNRKGPFAAGTKGPE